MSTQQLIDLPNGMYVPAVSLVSVSGESLSTLIVAGKTATASVEFSRPANTTAYTALDVINGGSLMSFAGMARIAGGAGYITKARLMTDLSTCTAAMRLHLYHTAPTVISDNSPLASLYADKASRIGYLDFDAMGTEGSGSTAASSLNANARLAFICASSNTTIFGVLSTKDAFTPASAQNFYVELTAEQN